MGAFLPFLLAVSLPSPVRPDPTIPRPDRICPAPAARRGCLCRRSRAARPRGPRRRRSPPASSASAMSLDAPLPAALTLTLTLALTLTLTLTLTPRQPLVS